MIYEILEENGFREHIGIYLADILSGKSYLSNDFSFLVQAKVFQKIEKVLSYTGMHHSTTLYSRGIWKVLICRKDVNDTIYVFVLEQSSDQIPHVILDSDFDEKQILYALITLNEWWEGKKCQHLKKNSLL